MIVVNFQDYAFFGVSATGCAAVNGEYPRVDPIRVEDPLLWLLYRLGVIDATQPDARNEDSKTGV